MHRPSVITGEYKIITVPAITIGNAQFFLTGFILAQQLHRFFRQADIANVFRLGRTLVYTAILGVQQIVIDLDALIHPIHFAPMQTHNLSPTTAGNDQQVRNDAPLHRLVLQRPQNFPQYIWLKVICSGMYSPRRRSLVRRVVWHNHLPLGLCEHYADKLMIFPNGLRREFDRSLVCNEQLLNPLSKRFRHLFRLLTEYFIAAARRRYRCMRYARLP